MTKDTNDAVDVAAWEGDAGSTRHRILDAALDVFSREGYHATRMDDIVQRSGASKGAIYFHFPNKEKLFLGLVDQFADLLERRVKAAIKQVLVDQGSVDSSPTTVQLSYILAAIAAVPNTTGFVVTSPASNITSAAGALPVLGVVSFP